MKIIRNRVGLGTYPFAWNKSSQTRSNLRRILTRFLDCGGYYIDTAPVYGFGEIETALGEILPSLPRDSFHISTKCGYIDVEGKTFRSVQKSASYRDVIRECERSLARLHLDYIDLYIIHWLDPNTPADETMKALLKLKEDGKIIKIGIANVTTTQLAQYYDRKGISYVQNRFSLLYRNISSGMEQYLQKSSISLIPYRVVERGLLTDSMIQKGPIKQPSSISLLHDWIYNKLRPIAMQKNISLSQLSISWVLHQKDVGFVIIGITNPDYIEQNLSANLIILNSNILADIEDAYRNLTIKIQSSYGQSVHEFIRNI